MPQSPFRASASTGSHEVRESGRDQALHRTRTEDHEVSICSEIEAPGTRLQANVPSADVSRLDSGSMLMSLSPANAPHPDDDAVLVGDPLDRSKDAFIAHWADMGSSWGVPRSVAEVHALLFIEGQPLCAEDIMERLQVSRGSVSTTLRTLADWGIVTRSRPRGERKEFFEAEQDVWNLLSLIVRARKRRELEPLLAALEDTRSVADGKIDRRRGEIFTNTFPELANLVNPYLENLKR